MRDLRVLRLALLIQQGRVVVPCGDTHVYSIDYNIWPGFVFTDGFDLNGVFGE
jgi:hypothetical protein